MNRGFDFVNQTNSNTAGTGIARARTCDPITSHQAARFVTTENVVDKIGTIVSILERWDEVGRHPEYESGYRSKSIANICQIYQNETGLDVWVYGTLGTTVHRAVEAGQIYVSGKTRHHQSLQLQETYELFPAASRAISLAAWIMLMDNSTEDKRNNSSAKRRKALEEKREQELIWERWNPTCNGDGSE
jgi:hypothetical protein